MSDVKWIKIVADMFEDSKIEFIRSLPEGDSIIVTWMQMLSIAGQSNMGGYLMVTDDIPYSEQFLSSKLKRQPVFLQFALETLVKLKMVNIEDGPYHITNWERYQNIDGLEKIRLQAAERKRKQRERDKLLLTGEMSQKSVTSHVTVTENVTHEVTPCHATELELELDKEKDINNMRLAQFELFWSYYPQKKGKAKAQKKWLSYGNKINIDEVMEGTKKYVEYCKLKNRFLVDGSTFVNNQSWNDDWEIKPTPIISDNRTSIPDWKKKELAQKRYEAMEIARNKWINKGNDPDAFVYDPDTEY